MQMTCKSLNRHVKVNLIRLFPERILVSFQDGTECCNNIISPQNYFTPNLGYLLQQWTTTELCQGAVSSPLNPINLLLCGAWTLLNCPSARRPRSVISHRRSRFFRFPDDVSVTSCDGSGLGRMSFIVFNHLVCAFDRNADTAERRGKPFSVSILKTYFSLLNAIKCIRCV